jgi:hypothetical protein
MSLADLSKLLASVARIVDPECMLQRSLSLSNSILRNELVDNEVVGRNDLELSAHEMAPQYQRYQRRNRTLAAADRGLR